LGENKKATKNISQALLLAPNHFMANALSFFLLTRNEVR
jgi:hypothetical protein